MRRVLPPLAALAALLTACSGSPDEAAPVVSTSVPVVTTEATTTSAPPPSTTTTAARGPERCRTADLRIAQVEGGAALGHAVGIFEVRNASSAPCRLTGYPGVELLDQSGRVLAEGLRRAGYILGDRPPVAVTIRPGASAWFGIEWRNVCEGGDPVAESDHLRVIVPDETAPAVVPAVIPVCAEPSILVSPVRAQKDELNAR